MPVTFDDLCDKYGDAKSIPNDSLYEFLSTIRTDLENRASMGSQGVESIKTSPFGIEIRRRCKQDLIWLAGYFMWETNPDGGGRGLPQSANEIREESHGVMCRKLFVQKDDSKSIADQSTIKTRLLLFPRGGMKTTCDIADTIQWILNFPEIRILFMSGDSGFAGDILDETKGHFVVKVGEPSLMNLFFPEFCKEEKNLGAFGEYLCPEWEKKQIRRREPTILAAGVDSTLSGKHFDLIKGDDMVSNRNSENEEQCRKATKNFNVNIKMLMPYGYVDIIGTRYNEVDMYGDMLQKFDASMSGNMLGEVETGPGWVLSTNPDMNMKVLIGRSIQIKPEVAEQLEREGKEVSYVNAGEAGCVLLLPRTQTFSFLTGDYAKDEIVFEGQRNQNPRPAIAITFDEALLNKNTIPYQDLPHNYLITHLWDLAYSQKKGADYSVGSSFMWDSKRNAYVHDMVRAKFKPSELAKAVVDFTKKHKPQIVAIEDSNGARFLEDAMRIEARKTGDPRVIQLIAGIKWLPVSNVKEAKKSRMASLHPWFMDGRLKILNSLPHLDIAKSEFEKCLISHHHDDIPDNWSRQQEIAPVVEEASTNVFDPNAIPVDRQTAILRAGWNLIFEENCDAFGNPGMGTPPIMTLLEDITTPMEDTFENYDSGEDSILGAGW